MDPLAGEFQAWSPYNYTFCDPIKYTDPDGRNPILGALKATVRKFRNFVNSIFGTNIPLTGQSKPQSVTYGRVDFSASGRIEVGAGLSVEGDFLGLGHAEATVDAGSINLIEVEIGTQGVSGNIIDSDNNSMEREISAKIGAVGGTISAGIGAKQEKTETNGIVTKDMYKLEAGITAGNTTYGLSTGTNTVSPSVNNTSELKSTLGFQTIIGAEVEFKMTITSSNNKDDIK